MSHGYWTVRLALVLVIFGIGSVVVIGSIRAGFSSSEKEDTKAKAIDEQQSKKLPKIIVKKSDASSEEQMTAYTDKVINSDVTFGMVPIRGGTFLMGSPKSEKNRQDDEGPRHKVKVDPFWMGKCEVTWDEYEVFMYSLDAQFRRTKKIKPTLRELFADATTRPTKPYTDMTFDMGKKGYPAICMTQLAAKMYCKWLSRKTGRYYRLPTEAEWEYAARAGTTTAYYFGDDPKKIDAYEWHYENSDEAYHQVGKKKPNPWGLYDMHGNVAEWVLDAHDTTFYKKSLGKTVANPLNIPMKLYPRVARGGSWDDDVEMLRSASRRPSDKDWKQEDPQFPQSVWYHTDALFLGFRIVRPLNPPTEEELKKIWEAGYDDLVNRSDKE